MRFITRWRKKSHVQEMYRTTEKKMWALEFLRKKMRVIREGFRNDYDRLKEQVDAATMRIGTEREKPEAEQDKQIIENLEKLIVRITPDIEQLKKQMSEIEQNIEGQGGINENIDGYKQVMGMLQEFRHEV